RSWVYLGDFINRLQAFCWEKNLVIRVPQRHSGCTMKVEFYGHVRQYRNLQKEIDGNLQQVLLSGQYVMGPMLKRFEEELARYHGMKYALGVGNGTDAIWLTLMALDIGPGDLDRRRNGGVCRL